MATQYSTVATGGTFDLLHKGHLELLRKAFSVSSFVIIGLSSDYFAAKRGKIPFHNYIQRFENLSSLIQKHFPNSSFEIIQLCDDFGPAVFQDKVKALIVSDETCNQGTVLNDRRESLNLSPVDIVTIPMILAQDGIRISSTRLQNSEIDFDGNKLLT